MLVSVWEENPSVQSRAIRGGVVECGEGLADTGEEVSSGVKVWW